MAAPCENVCISGLPAGMDEAAVKGIFGAYGDITSIKVVGQQAYVKFATVDEAKWIQENLSGNMPEGLTEPIDVKFSAEKGKGKDGAKGGKDNWSNGGYGKGGKGEKGESWGPYAKGGKDSGKESWGKDSGGKDKGKGDAKGKDGKSKGKGKIGIKTLFDGLCEAGALPGATASGKYENDENTLFVGGLPVDTTDLDLYKIMSPFGAIAPKGIRAMTHFDTGNCKGYGFVNFMEGAAAQAAIAALNGTTMGDEGAVLEVMSKRLGGGSGDGKGDGKADGKGDGKGKAAAKGKWKW